MKINDFDKEIISILEQKEKPNLSFEDLSFLIEEMISQTPVESSEEDLFSESNKINIEDILGTLNINVAKWGDPNVSPEGQAQERQIIQNYVSALGGATPDEILKNLETALIEESHPEKLEEDIDIRGNCNLAQAVSKIQLLNTLSAILKYFEASTAGFIMEAFLSAVFGGKVIPARESEGIEDFVIESPSVGNQGETHYSLKTKRYKSSIDGSVLGLMRTLIAQDEVVYYFFGKTETVKEDGEKGEVGSIAVHKFILNNENVTNYVDASKVALARQMLLGKEQGPEAEADDDTTTAQQLENNYLATAPGTTFTSRGLEEGSPLLKFIHTWVSATKSSQSELQTPAAISATLNQQSGVIIAEEDVFDLAAALRASGFMLPPLESEKNIAERKRKTKKKKEHPGQFDIKFDSYSSAPDGELVAEIVIDSDNLLRIADRELGDMKQQLIDVQKRFKKLVYEMHLYLSTLNSSKAEQLKQDSELFNTTVQTKIQGDESCKT